MGTDIMEVTQNIYKYFRESLPQYTAIEIRKKSYHPDDSCLYMVSTKKTDGTYAVWTCWDEHTRSLNHGHYGLPDMESCARVMAECQAPASAPENSTPLQILRTFLIKRDIYFEDPCQELLYITGYADGIRAQQEYRWNRLENADTDILFAEALES